MWCHGCQEVEEEAAEGDHPEGCGVAGGDAAVTFCTFHHLLPGKEHKKELEMMAALLGPLVARLNKARVPLLAPLRHWGLPAPLPVQHLHLLLQAALPAGPSQVMLGSQKLAPWSYFVKCPDRSLQRLDR